MSWTDLLSDEWKGMPWQIWKPPQQLWHEMPTFVLAEWCYRITTLVALFHACVTGRKKSWCAAWICGTANDIFFMFLPICDNFWQGQASVMITPRLPLYIVEMYASVMYFAPVAASLFSRANGLNPYAQACITGLLCHLFYGVYDINGPRYLWWTWHDGDPAISERNYNAPYGSSMWILTYCGLQSFLNSWILRGKGARLTGTLPPSAHNVSATAALHTVLGLFPVKWLQKLSFIKDFLLTGAGYLDGLQNWLGASSDITQILYRAIVCTPLFMIAMGQMSFFSLDKLGIPGKRTYVFTLVIMMSTVAQQLWAGRKRAASPPLPTSYKRANWLFMAALVGHFTTHTLINCYGDPTNHASTGIHQKIAEPQTTVYDIMGWERPEELPLSGPHMYSKHDYSFTPVRGSKVDLPAGAIEARLEGVHSMWYTVYGKQHKDRVGEWRQGLWMSVMGLAAFAICMFKDL